MLSLMKNKLKIKINFTPMWTLFLIFLVLRLINVIDWSWWWVTCPLWIVPSVFLCIYALCGVIYLIFAVVVWLVERFS